jgi:hypothetical protein
MIEKQMICDFWSIPFDLSDCSAHFMHILFYFIQEQAQLKFLCASEKLSSVESNHSWRFQSDTLV